MKIMLLLSLFSGVIGYTAVMPQQIAPGVQLEPYSAKQFPTLKIRKGTEAYTSNFGVLVNNSAKDITAFAVQWISSTTGKPVFIRDESMYLQNTQIGVSPVVAKGGGQYLIDVPTGITSVFDKPGEFSISVDCLIFADGSTIGQDTLNFANDITAQYQAAQHFAGQVRSRQTAAQVLANIQANGSVISRVGTIGRNWLLDYASRGATLESRPATPASGPTGTQALEAMIQHIEHMPIPPAFHRE